VNEISGVDTNPLRGTSTLSMNTETLELDGGLRNLEV
jgi:hypothetical protein